MNLGVGAVASLFVSSHCSEDTEELGHGLGSSQMLNEATIWQIQLRGFLGVGRHTHRPYEYRNRE
jgi:hypothetical protein